MQGTGHRVEIVSNDSRIDSDERNHSSVAPVLEGSQADTPVIGNVGRRCLWRGRNMTIIFWHRKLSFLVPDQRTGPRSPVPKKRPTNTAVFVSRYSSCPKTQATPDTFSKVRDLSSNTTQNKISTLRQRDNFPVATRNGPDVEVRFRRVFSTMSK
jgi:hypothetical protein